VSRSERPTDLSRQDDARQNREHALGLISFGVFLVVLASLYYLYPVTLSDLTRMLATLRDEHMFQVPANLYQIITLFFTALAVWHGLAGAVVMVLGDFPLGLDQWVSAGLAFAFGQILDRGIKGLIGYREVIAFILVAVGVAVILSGIAKNLR